MGKFKERRKYILLFFIVVLVIIISVRIYIVNKDRHYYEAYRQDVKTGDTITLGGIDLTFGKISEPIIEDTTFDEENHKMAVYKLPIVITKKINGPLDEASSFGIFEVYKDYQNIAEVQFTSEDGENFFSILDSLKEGEKIEIIVTTDFILGDLWHYYDDYNVDKPAYIVIGGSPSSKGIPQYYFKLQDQS